MASQSRFAMYPAGVSWLQSRSRRPPDRRSGSPRPRPIVATTGLLTALLLGPAIATSAPRPADDLDRLAPGRFLVASRGLGDPNFRRTVVLLVEYDRREGALGLVINRPSDVDLSRLLSPASDDGELGAVYLGGPVEPLEVTLLVRAPEPPEGARRVFADVHFSGSRELLEQLALPTAEGTPFRAYAGYSGWAIGQLEAEVSVGGWHVVDGRASAVFDDSPDDVWPRLILVGSAEWARLEHLDQIARIRARLSG